MVEACWILVSSSLFSDEEKNLIAEKLKNKINKEGVLSVKSSETRSQLENKLIATKKILALVHKSLVVAKKRRPTRPTKAAKEKRLESKKRESSKKEMRRPPNVAD